MVQRGGSVTINVQNVTLFVCVATLVMVACVLFKTCVNEGFAGQGNNGPGGGGGGGGGGNGQGNGVGNRPNNGHNHGNNAHNNGGSSGYSVSDCSGCTGTNFGSQNNCPYECE